MKTILLLLTLTLLRVSVFAQASHFRQVRWGYTPKEVMATESRKPIFASAFNVTYDSIPIFGYIVDLSYSFEGNRLYAASYNARAAPRDSAKIKGLFDALLLQAVNDSRLHPVMNDGSNQLTTRVFQAEDNKAVFFWGRLKNADYRLEVSYSKPGSKPTLSRH